MVKLQHRHRRDGGITVGSARYQLDSEGCVEVTEEHAEVLRNSRDLQGPDWGEPGSWAALIPPTPVVPGQARRPRTREELQAAAAAAGIKPHPEPETPAEPEPEPPTAEGSPAAEWTMDNTKAELVDAAKDLGIEVPRWATKTKLLELIKAQQGD